VSATSSSNRLAFEALVESGSDPVRLVLEHVHDLVLIIDPAGTILWASPSHHHFLGRDPEEVIGRSVSEFLHPDDLERQRTVLRERVQQGSYRKTELRVQHADGTWIDVESIGVPMFGTDGRVDKIVITARDVRGYKQMERRLIEEEHRLRVIVEQMPANVWTTDADLRVTSSLGGGLAAVGLKPNQLVGVLLGDHFQGDPRREAVIAVHRRALAGEVLAYESQWADRDLFVQLRPMRDTSGRITGTIGITFDLTEQKRAERRYRELFERNLAGVFRSTAAGQLLECNEAFARIFGYEAPGEMARQVNTRELYWLPSDRDEVVGALRSRGELRNFELRMRTRDGQLVWGLLNEAVVPGDEGEDVLEGTIIDITARKLAEERIEYQAFHDALTDLPNRFLFNDRLQVALAQAKRHGRSTAVLFLDLDQFKLINDTMAHTAGDELLRHVAERLVACIRPDDTVARLGGDEFVFVLADIHQAPGAATVAQKVLETIRRPFQIQGRELYVTASIGIAVAPHDGDDIETLVKNADSAMYRAKELGRNTFQFHTPLAQRRAEIRLTLETALRHALERDEFFLVYQPQVTIGSKRITGFEALIRWNRPGFGIVEPKDFIPLAEELGTIIPIGEWVLRTACRQLREWHRSNPDLRMAVNLSPRQFQHDELTRIVERAIEESGIDASRLELEVTESLSMRDSDLTIGRLSHFRNLGIRIALDDFGTGYSSLARLRYLPIDSIKIDRSFIIDLADEGPEKPIVQAIVTMAQSLDLRVIAEGVETEEQCALLESLGCIEIQGFVYSRPLPAEEAGLLVGYSSPRP
jgi:diguanylate cyclase (GGDEF)-like protein/PAS domain S-box-containing protein